MTRCTYPGCKALPSRRCRLCGELTCAKHEKAHWGASDPV